MVVLERLPKTLRGRRRLASLTDTFLGSVTLGLGTSPLEEKEDGWGGTPIVSCFCFVGSVAREV